MLRDLPPIVKDGEIRSNSGIVYRYKNSEMVEVVHPDGGTIQYKNSKIHADDSPAIKFSNGYQEYRINGVRHRTDGPAIINADGSTEFWENGELMKVKGKGYSISYKNSKIEKFVDIMPRRVYAYFIERKRFVKNEND